MGSSFNMGFSENIELPEEVFDFSCIYFGRVPGTLSLTNAKLNNHEIITPELPWMILFKNHFNPIVVNGLKFNLHKSRCGKFGILGMGDLETITNFSEIEYKYVIDTSSYTGESIKVIIPINANGLNSGLIQIEHKE